MMENMTSFDMLALVASQAYTRSSGSEELFPETKKPSRKRHFSSDSWTFEEIKAMSAKALVARFAQFTSDELTKKYYYQCRLLPGKCSKTEFSFGNEQKAWNLMKVHLKAHLSENSSELDLRLFAKSPTLDEQSTCSDSVQKPSKKIKLPSETEASSDNDSQASSDYFRFQRKSDFPNSKKMLDYGCEPSTARRKRYTPKQKTPSSNGSRYFPTFDEWRKNKNLLPKADYSLLDIATFMCRPMNYVSPLFAPRQYDHDYCDRPPVALRNFEEHIPEFLPPMKRRPKVQKQFIIKTPRFPYLHDMEEYVVSEIVEIDSEGNSTRRRQRVETDCLDIKSYLQSKIKEERSRSSTPSFLDMLPISDTQDVTGSVLHCVENKFMKKYCAIAPKLSYSSSDNDENSENVKRVKKELALKHITQLNSKKKKTCQGPLECQLCDDGRQFTAVASLMHHYRSHAGIKLYVCDICHDTFTRQHSLNYHMMIHQNRSRFECEVCGRTFRHPSHFKEHMRRHTGETPFQCPCCDMLFKTRNTYKRHLRMQHNKILTARGIADSTEDTPSCSRKLKK